MTTFNGENPGSGIPDFSGPIVFGGQVTAEGGVLIPDGTDSAPSLAFITDTKTGLEKSGTNEISYVCNGSKRLRVNPSTTTVLSSQLSIPDGTDPTPGLCFNSDNKTGIFNNGGRVGISSAGTSVAAFDPTTITLVSPGTTIQSDTLTQISTDSTTALSTVVGSGDVATTLGSTPLYYTSSGSTLNFGMPVSGTDFTFQNGTVSGTLSTNTLTSGPIIGSSLSVSTVGAGSGVFTGGLSSGSFTTGALSAGAVSASTLSASSQPYYSATEGTAAQTLTTGSDTIIKFNNVNSTSSAISYNSTTGIFTTTVAGVYNISYWFGYNNNSTGTRRTWIDVGGTNYSYNNVNAVNGDSTYIQGGASIKMPASQTFSIKGNQNSGGNLNLGSCNITITKTS